MFSLCDSVVFFSFLVILYLSLGGITKGSRRMRLLGKFVENECEKIDRLMEFYTRYICCGEKRISLLFRLLNFLIAWCACVVQVFRKSERRDRKT